MRSSGSVPDPLEAFWSVPEACLRQRLGTSEQGLTSAEASRRLDVLQSTRIARGNRLPWLAPLLRQFSSPIILILIAAAVLSVLLDSLTEALIILAIVLISGLLGFWQEHGASRALQRLLETVHTTCCVRRDGREQTIRRDALVPGDLLVLAAGASIAADCRLLEQRNLSLDESALTGESFAVRKDVMVVAVDTPLAQRRNTLHGGTHVVSGTGLALVVAVGADTAFGAIAAGLQQAPADTEFEHGVRRFGALLLEVTLLLVLAIFAFNVFLQRPVAQSFLFALALGVGLTPQLLPAILSVTLAQGARRMAAQRVIVKRLAAIENFGSMTVLCADKTGTLTEGLARVHRCADVAGQPSARVFAMALVNACFESGFPNAIDAGLRRSAESAAPFHPGSAEEILAGWTKLDEVPFDFDRKRQSILARRDGLPVLITKGSFAAMLAVCDQAEAADGSLVPLAAVEPLLRARFRQWSAEGDRVLGVAIRTWTPQELTVPLHVDRSAETGMTLLGLVALHDPLKPDMAATVAELRQAGVTIKLISGDNALVAERVARQAGLGGSGVLTGRDLDRLTDQALPVLADQHQVFAEIEPRQKARLVRALHRAGHVVGFLGDGINDAPALHAADVGLSVQGAVDVAKEAADIVLLESDLGVLLLGIREGRRTFANTLKYVFMATSANFGNMLSMAGASLLLPFLPLLPTQIMLTNLLTDLPEMTIATDRVDPSWIERPRRWNLPFIRQFMLTFGLVSSLFDGLTFVVLLVLLKADVAQFRTGWFQESVSSAAMIVLVIRTEGPLLGSRPSRWLVASTVLVIGFTLLLPQTALGHLFGLVPLPPRFLALLALVLIAYVATAEWIKRRFYRHLRPHTPP